ncbi:carbohydrate binding domain-containing protein [Stenotrophomonas bentonitica]
MQERKITLIDIGAGALPSVTPVTAQNSSWFPTVYVSPETPPVDGVTPEPVADGVLIEWDAVDQAGVVYIIERGPSQNGPWTEIHRTTETRYLYSDGSGQKWFFRITASVRGKPGQGTVVEATPAPTTAELIAAQQKLDKEIVDRALADANEAASRVRDIALVNAGLVQEAQTRVTQIGQAMDAVAAESQTRATQLLNEKTEREAAITAVSETQQNGFDSLSRALSEVAAGSGTQFDSKRIWDFNLTVENWTGNGAPVLVDGWLRPANAAANAYVQSPAGLAIDGSAYRYVKMRIKKVGKPTWAGALQWITTTDATWNAAKRVAMAEPAWDSNGVATMDAADVPWWPATVAAIRLQLGAAQALSDYYLIDWVAIGRPSPGASVALVQEQAQAQTTALAAEASKRDDLAVQMRGSYTGSDLSKVTQGFMADERTARATADTAQLQRITTMEARMPAGSGGLATSASVTTLQDAMVAADQANAQATTKVSSDLRAAMSRSLNLVINGDIGNDLAGWQITGGQPGTWSVSATEGRGGGKCLKGTSVPFGVVTSAQANLNEGIEVKVGRRYRLRAWVKVSADYVGDTDNSKIRVGAVRTDGTEVLLWSRVYNSGWTNWTVVENVFTIAEGTARFRLSAGLRNTAGYVLVDDFEFVDITDEELIASNASGLTAISTRVGVVEGTLVSQGTALTQVQADVAGKASNAALTSLDSKVTQLGNTVTSQGTALTSVNAKLSVLGEVKSYQITANAVISGQPSNGPRATGIRNPAGAMVAPAGRGFGVVLINADSTLGSRNGFDTWADANGNAQAMADFIATIPENQYFIVYTSDSVGTLLPGGVGAAALRAALVDAGGTTAAVGALTGSRMYILIGRRKFGAGAGTEVLSPASTSARTDLWCEYTLQVLNGVPIGADDKRAMAQALDATVAATSTLTGKVTALEGTTTAQGQAITSVNAQLAATQQAGPNILIDAGFEGYAADALIYQAGTGTLRAIAASAGARAYVGARAARLLRTGAPSNTNTDTYFGPEILTNEGRVYFVEAWLKNDPDAVAPGGATYSIGVTGINSAGVRAWYSAPTTGSQRMDALANWTKISGYVTISNPTVKAQLWATIQGRNGQTPQNVALLIDNVMWQDVTDAYGAKTTADAAATGLSALTTTVTQQGGQITALGQQVNQVGASVAGKADASVVQTLTAMVKDSMAGGGNLIPNTMFKDGASDWVWAWNDAGFWENPAVNLLGDNSYWPPGMNALGFRSLNGGSPPVGQTRYGAIRNRVAVPVAPGKRYCSSVWLNPFRCEAVAMLTFYNANNQMVSEHTGAVVPRQDSTTATLATLPRGFVIATAPPGAVKACMGWRAQATGPQHTTPYLWGAQPMLEEMRPEQVGPSPWSAGGSESFAGYSMYVTADGLTGGLVTKNDGKVVDMKILANVLQILSPNKPEGIEMRDGYIRVWKGNSQRIIGTGFGSGDLMDYFGPNVGAGAANKQNATVWMDVNGNAYFGGTLSAGIWKNANRTDSTAPYPYVEVGPFPAHGRQRLVVASFSTSSPTYTTWYDGRSWNNEPPPPSISTTTVLRLRRNAGGGLQLVSQQAFQAYSVLEANIYHDRDAGIPQLPNGGWQQMYFFACDGSFTATEPGSTFQNFVYEAAITAQGIGQIGRQSMSVVSTEEP